MAFIRAYDTVGRPVMDESSSSCPISRCGQSMRTELVQSFLVSRISAALASHSRALYYNSPASFGNPALLSTPSTLGTPIRAPATGPGIQCRFPCRIPRSPSAPTRPHEVSTHSTAPHTTVRVRFWIPRAARSAALHRECCGRVGGYSFCSLANRSNNT